MEKKCSSGQSPRVLTPAPPAMQATQRPQPAGKGFQRTVINAWLARAGMLEVDTSHEQASAA